MKTSAVTINLENPEDNDHFYAWPEPAIELEEGRKQIDLIAISVAITDIDDYADYRYDAVVSASKREVIVKMPKQPKHHYNSDSREQTSYNFKGHQFKAKAMKEDIMNFSDESVCKKIHIQLSYEVTTEYFNDNVSTGLRPIKWVDEEKAFPLELEKGSCLRVF
jgi:predicted ATPase